MSEGIQAAVFICDGVPTVAIGRLNGQMKYDGMECLLIELPVKTGLLAIGIDEARELVAHINELIEQRDIRRSAEGQGE
jgi:hypothetical protein